MKIILVATNARGKNLVFVTDTLQAYSLPEALQLAKDGKLKNLYSVNGNTGAYLRTNLSYLYKYVAQPKHSIFFAAAKMRALVDEWKKYVDINKSPDIIATLYSLKDKTPHADPQPNDRGLQIANEFYKLAKEWLH